VSNLVQHAWSFSPLDTYIYDHARTINWEKWLGGTALYAFFFAVVGAQVDRIPRVSFLEVAMQIAILLPLAWPLRRRR